MPQGPPHPSPSAKAKIGSPTNVPNMISQRKARNNEQGVNKLPSDILSYVFAIGEEVERSVRQWRVSNETKYIGFQELSSQVCSHWREVAIHGPRLWSYIHITRPPGQIVSLYVCRAGPTIPLDIELDMSEEYWDRTEIDPEDHTSQTQHIPHVLNFLSTHGAKVNRWKSLRVSATRYEALVPLMDLLNAEQAPSLRFLSWERRLSKSFYQVDETKFGSDEFWAFSKTSLPRLRSLNSRGLPLHALFRGPSVGLTGLTKLSLTPGNTLFDLTALRDLLSASPQLKSLFLDTGLLYHQYHIDPIAPRVCLPALCSLQIFAFRQAPWILRLLQMLDLPGLHELTLDFPTRTSTNPIWRDDQIATYITGKVSPHDLTTISTSGLTSSPIYPSLRTLDISRYTCSKKELIDLFSALPLIVQLGISGSQAASLGKAPCVLPNLVTLKFSRFVYPHLGHVLQCRERAGFPIKTILVHKDFRLHVKDELPDTVNIEVYWDYRFQREYRDDHQVLEDRLEDNQN